MIIFRYDLIMAMASPPHTVILREGMQTLYSNLGVLMKKRVLGSRHQEDFCAFAGKRRLEVP